MADTLFDTIARKHMTFRNDVLDPPALPDVIRTFLGRIMLLHGVPLPYLVPHENLLEPESLKFFHLDSRWLNAFLGGALATGHPDNVRPLLNKGMDGIFARLVESVHDTRRNNRKTSDAARAEADEEEASRQARQPSGGNASPAQPTSDFSGFMLRSRLLAGWQGIEFTAYDSGAPPKELAFLRLERLAPDVLFGLVNGRISSLEIGQPPEGLHFGVQPGMVGPDRRVDVRAIAGKGNGSAELANRLKETPLRTIITIGGSGHG